MRKKILAFVAAVACLGLTGCALGGNVIPLSTALERYGPLPADYQLYVMNCIERKLIDPESATFEFFTPEPREKGWGGEVYVNAKNRFGGYVGRRLWDYLLVNKDGTVRGGCLPSIW